MLHEITLEELPDRWDWIAARCAMPGLQERLTGREAAAYRIDGTDAALIMSVGTTKGTGARALWIEGLGGHVGRNGTKNRRLLGAVLDECAAFARASDCDEIRIEANNRSALKLRLFTAFGFEEGRLPGSTFLRKAVR